MNQVVDDPATGPRADGATEEGVQSVAHLKELLQSIEARRHVGGAGAGRQLKTN